MILYSENKNKFFWLFILVFVTSGLIVWQRIKFSPWQQVNIRTDVTLEKIGSETAVPIQEIKDSFGVVKDQTIDLQAELIKEQQRQELLQTANQYLNEKNIQDQ